jgi:hypothetical protein
MFLRKKRRGQAQQYDNDKAHEYWFHKTPLSKRIGYQEYCRLFDEIRV